MYYVRVLGVVMKISYLYFKSTLILNLNLILNSHCSVIKNVLFISAGCSQCISLLLNSHFRDILMTANQYLAHITLQSKSNSNQPSSVLI